MTTFGERLRRERKARGVSLNEIAEATKIGARYLEAIESDQFDRLPGGVFDRGFVRAYAEAVGLDPAATVEAYLEQRSARTTDEPDRTLEVLRQAADTRATHAPARRAVPRALLFGAGTVVAVACVAGAWIWTRPPAPPSPAPTTAFAASVPTPTTDRAETAADPPEVDSPQPAPARDPVEQRVDERRGGAAASRLAARVVIDRPVSGSLNCDNRRVEVLDGLRGGTELELDCRRFLIVQVADGGALRIGLGDAAPRTLGPDGQPLQRQLVP